VDGGAQPALTCDQLEIVVNEDGVKDAPRSDAGDQIVNRDVPLALTAGEYDDGTRITMDDVVGNHE
jgi:hypothetical protein